MKRKTMLLTLSLIAVLAAGASLHYLRNGGDVYHTRERRAAKDAMIQSIRADLAAAPTPAQPGDGEWYDGEAIFNEDGSWLAYRSRCHKQDPKVYDLFIAKGSDGKWYYSSYHFCIDAMVLGSNDQAASLDEFKRSYSLMEFDGESDDALAKTWPNR
ncbi:hypothetical protein OJ996_12265 [Luteolibacter sp. GHJ8]|uniref:Uncharacterized protein n=1 Tax=Luteolibacter rhizosphaerae TaxID=2989719 RepID=A0ABT3G3E3_9BACT|nr:hypothetical protein [Luteolibacter rhizosphaerae]MCW1914355.1 hypothetical protein [Luteolibacter rhizosphaerae]